MPKLSRDEREKRAEAALQRRLAREDRERRLKRWYIKGSWKPGFTTGDPEKWKSWRRFFVVPILFRSEEEAWAYGRTHMFKHMGHLQKLTYSVETRWLKDA